MIELALDDGIVVVAEFGLESLGVVGRSGYYAVNECVGEVIAVFYPSDEIFAEICLAGMAEHIFAQLGAVVLDELAGDEEETLVGVAVEMTVAQQEKTGDFTGNVAGMSAMMSSAS